MIIEISLGRAIFISLIILLGTNIFAQDVNSGRVGYYIFSGNTNDLENSNNGINNGASLTLDRFGNPNSAYTFDGLNDYIEIPHSNDLNFNVNDDFSVSIWVFIPNSQNNIGSGVNEILGKWNAVNNTGYPYAIRYLNETAANNNAFKFATLRYDNETCANNPLNISPCPIETNNWYHIVFVKSGNQLILYQNGEVKSTVTDNTNTACGTLNTEPIYIGKRQANQRHFTGKIDDISFYNRAITTAEVKLLLNENSWEAPVTVSGEADFISFSIPEQIAPAIVDITNQSIKVEAACNTDLINLTPSFTTSLNSSVFVNNIEQTSGSTSNNFNSPVQYKIIAEDNCNSKDWIITVTNQTISDSEKLNLASFENFYLDQQIETPIIDLDEKTIEIIVACETNIENLIPEFQLSPGATAFVNNNEQISKVNAQDFTSTVLYHVISENECANLDWKVTVSKEEESIEEIFNKTLLKSFNLQGHDINIDVNNELEIISAKIPCYLKRESFIAEFELSDDAELFLNEELIVNKQSINFLSNDSNIITIANACGQRNLLFQIESNISVNDSLLFVPNVITPNNDNKNDIWEIINKSQNSLDVNVKIYNRWGRPVYQQNNYNNDWDAHNLASGIYYYQITINNCDNVIPGWVQVIK